jgi:hypothetical protein
MLLQLGNAFHTLFDESNPLMQDFPNYAAEPMGDGPNGRLVAQSRQQPAEYCLEVTAFLPGRSVGRLLQYPPQIFVSLCRTAVVVLFGAFLLPGQVPTQEVNCPAEGNVSSMTEVNREQGRPLFGVNGEVCKKVGAKKKKDLTGSTLLEMPG